MLAAVEAGCPIAEYSPAEIKRAVATGQAQVGEVLISIHENEDPIYGVDVVPFLAWGASGAPWGATSQTYVISCVVYTSSATPRQTSTSSLRCFESSMLARQRTLCGTSWCPR